MNSNKLLLALALLCAGLLLLAGAVGAGDHSSGVPLSAKEKLGKSIFFDEDLSLNENQSCATCHAPEVGWAGPDQAINKGGGVYEGSVAGAFGDRRPPVSAYATTSPIFHLNEEGLFVGGNFWDGRATGEKLGNPAADQAQGPFLNPVEQALPDSACVVYRVCTADYRVSLNKVWGRRTCDIAWPADVEAACATPGATVALSAQDRAASNTAYDYIALSIAAYEDSDEVNAFSSKYDLSLGRRAVKLTRLEQKGLELFNGKAMCNLCHVSDGRQALFTDYTFDNLGIPRNPANPVYLTNPDFVDPGLGGFLKNAGYEEAVYMAEWGKHKVPTLRNVDLRPNDRFVKAYGHNSYFKSLEGIVHFYNTRDVKPTCPGPYTEAEALAANCWPAPEVAMNVNTDELGNLGLTRAEERAIVAFLKTLNDGYRRGGHDD